MYTERDMMTISVIALSPSQYGPQGNQGDMVLPVIDDWYLDLDMVDHSYSSQLCSAFERLVIFF
jgi:hypothetical protein